MSELDVSKIEPVGEFGSKAWCKACAATVRILEDAALPEGLEWGFTEDYTHPPERLLADGRDKAAYYIMVKDGRVSGGDGVPDECLGLPGFHVQLQWAAICNQSATKYGRAGQLQRAAEEKVMCEEIAQYVDCENPLDLAPRPEPFWPAAVARALRKGAEEGSGLHNIAASLQMPSPEFAGLPITDLGVPVFSRMDEQQKASVLKILAVRT